MKARAVAYLLRGEVGAPFESREIGMAERMLGTASSPSRLVRLSNYTVSSDIAGVERYFRQALGYGAEVGNRPLPGRRAGLAVDQVQKRISKTASRYLRSGRGRSHPRQRPRAGSYGSLLLASFDPATNRHYSQDLPISCCEAFPGFSSPMSSKRSIASWTPDDSERLVRAGQGR